MMCFGFSRAATPSAKTSWWRSQRTFRWAFFSRANSRVEYCSWGSIRDSVAHTCARLTHARPRELPLRRPSSSCSPRNSTPRMTKHFPCLVQSQTHKPATQTPNSQSTIHNPSLYTSLRSWRHCHPRHLPRSAAALRRCAQNAHVSPCPPPSAAEAAALSAYVQKSVVIADIRAGLSAPGWAMLPPSFSLL